MPFYGITITNFNVALLILIVVVCAYVFFGGLNVLCTDVLQGIIMFVSMFLLIFAYWTLGGLTESHLALTNLASHYPTSRTVDRVQVGLHPSI